MGMNLVIDFCLYVRDVLIALVCLTELRFELLFANVNSRLTCLARSLLAIQTRNSYLLVVI